MTRLSDAQVVNSAFNWFAAAKIATKSFGFL